MSDFDNASLANRRYTVLAISLCLGVAGIGHLLDIWHGGWLPYRPAPWALNAYWTSLALLDVATAVLLTVRLRAGLVITLIILVSDVLINSYATYGMNLLERGWGLQVQSAFLGFVLGSTPGLWRARDPAHS